MVQKDVSGCLTIGQLLTLSAQRAPARTAVVLDGQEMTYREWDESAEEIARGLIAQGVRPGDRVGIFMPNSLTFLRVLFGILRLGAVAVPLHARYRTSELQYALSHAAFRAVCVADGPSPIGHVERFVEAWEARRGLASDPVVVDFSETPAGHGFLDASQLREWGRAVDEVTIAAQRDCVRASDIATMLYTSGTTAHPKGCLHTHRGLVTNAVAMARTRFFLTDEDRFWDPLPMTHVGFLLPMLAVVSADATVIATSHLDPTATFGCLADAMPTWLFPAFPAVAEILLNAADFDTKRLANVRMVMSTGSPTFLRRLQRALPHAIQISTYGSTETGGVVVFHEPGEPPEIRENNCGTPMPGVEIRIIATTTGSPLPPGSPGEILVRCPSLLSGYFRGADAPAESPVDCEGWLHTGDLGVLDEGGRLTYLGRLTDMLKVGGENVAAAEVESLISEHPSVAQAQVVGAPDQRLGEVVTAFVECHPDQQVTEQDIMDFCIGRIASFKVPRYVLFVEEWPMSATKIRKEALRERIAGDLAVRVGGKR